VQEVQRIRKALDSEGGNRTRAARSLGMSRVTLWHKMKQHGIDR
jgi:transcriptional regulator of acetoin/glycerol metabolism